MAVEAELKRRDQSGNLVDWVVNNDGSEPTSDLLTHTTLLNLLEELADKLEAGESIDIGNFPATQSVIGPLTDTQLRAEPVEVTITGSPTGGLTDAELRATPVEVTGDFASDGLTDAELRSTPVPISGTVTANLGTIDDVATETTLASLLTELGSILTKLDDLLESGESIDVGNFPATYPVTGTFWQATQPVSGTVTATTGGLTDAQLRATAVPISLDAAALLSLETTELGAGTLAALETVTVANPTANPETGLSKTVDTQAVRDRLPAALDGDGGIKVHLVNTDEAGLTDTQLRASAVPVSLASVPSHAVTGPLTDAQLRATAVPVVLDAAALAALETVQVGSLPAVALDAGTLAALENIVVSGTVALDAPTLAALETITAAISGSVAVTGTFWQATQPVSGPVTDAQLRASAVPVSNTVLSVVGPGAEATAQRVTLATETLAALENTTVTVGAALPAGTANIGDVDVLSLPSIPAGNNNIGDVDIASVPAPLNVVGGGTEAAALRVTLANNSTGLLPVSLASVPSHAVTNTVLSVVGAGAEATAQRVTLSTEALAALETISIGTALPAGNNNIGDVDVLTVPAPLNLVGGGTEAAALRVTLANNSTGVLAANSTETRPATGTLANVASSATNVTLKASNAARRGLTIVNESSANLYLKYGATASLTSYTYKIGPGAIFEAPFPVYTGIVDGLWDAANGNARVTEMT